MNLCSSFYCFPKSLETVNFCAQIQRKGKKWKWKWKWKWKSGKREEKGKGRGRESEKQVRKGKKKEREREKEGNKETRKQRGNRKAPVVSKSIDSNSSETHLFPLQSAKTLP